MKFLLTVPTCIQVFVGLATISCSMAQTNFAGLLLNDPRLSKFKQLLDRSGLSPNNAQTIFAPTNDALNNFEGEENAILESYYTKNEYFAHLREILVWHMVTEGAFETNDIFDGNRAVMENSIGNITINQQFNKIDNVAVVSFLEPNISSSDGVLHVIDDVIVPPYMAVNLLEHMSDRDTSAIFEYTTMVNLALFAGLDDKINDLYENGITFLVPPNRRFNRAQVDVPKLLTDEMKEYTRDFVLCSLIIDNYHEAGVFAFNDEQDQEQFLVTSELGTNLWITTKGGRLRFQSREVLLTDRVARNGIFHVVDLPLFPPFISDFAEWTHLSTSWDTSDCFRFFRQSLLSSQDISMMFNSSLTFFCPSREGFASFNNEDFQRLLSPDWERHATEFLLNHMSTPALTREELVNRAPSTIDMLNGARYELRRSALLPRIKNTAAEQAKSQYGDLIALDGYLHMIDTAITPTAVSRSIYDQSNENPDFSLLVENIDFVQLTDTVDRDTPLTLLAPNNQAFQRVRFDTLGGGEILKRHFFRGLLFCDVIANETQLVTVDDEILDVELRGVPGSGPWGFDGGQSLYVGGALIYNCDILARNGVLHHIDRVIGLDYETVSPTVTPSPTITPEPTVLLPPTDAPVEVPTEVFAPIVLPPILPGVVPSVKADDAAPPESSSLSRLPLAYWVSFGLSIMFIATSGL